MADIWKILKTQNCSSNGDLSPCQILFLYHYSFRGYQSFQLCGKGGQSHILRGSKGVRVTLESYGKVEISYINVDNKKRSKSNKSPNVVWET
jgi:hypothetical protein